MRILALSDFGDRDCLIGPAAAQTYDPAYPVLPACVQPGSQLLRMPLPRRLPQLQRVGIGSPPPSASSSLFASAHVPTAYRRHPRSTSPNEETVKTIACGKAG